ADFFNENYGTIEVGKDADFILLDGNPLESFSALKNVHGVYFNQQFLSTDMLNEMKQSLLKGVGK
ncbi:MAG: amidohydrolase family protein, partial [Flavobacterium sp.]